MGGEQSPMGEEERHRGEGSRPWRSDPAVSGHGGGGGSRRCAGFDGDGDGEREEKEQGRWGTRERG